MLYVVRGKSSVQSAKQIISGAHIAGHYIEELKMNVFEISYSAQEEVDAFLSGMGLFAEEKEDYILIEKEQFDKIISYIKR